MTNEVALKRAIRAMLKACDDTEAFKACDMDPGAIMQALFEALRDEFRSKIRGRK